MRLRSNPSSGGQEAAEAVAGTRQRREGRGWGPFTGAQLTVVVVAIAAMFAIPTAALAAAGAFTNNSATVPAVSGTNSNANGIGVQGTGTKYGVFSAGPLGVAFGKPLVCAGCVGPSDLPASARSLSSAYSNRGTVVLNGVNESEVASFNVPAGSYLLNWSASFWATTTLANGACYVVLPNDPFVSVDLVETGLAADYANILRGTASSTDTAANLPAGTVSLHCFANQAPTNVTGSLTMLKVGSVSH